MVNYYFDSCICIDHIENRFGTHGRPLGAYASKLFIKLIKNADLLLFSDVIIAELKARFTEEQITDMIGILSHLSQL